MGGRTSREMARCELESYVAAEMDASSARSRQADAIQKMVSLPEKNFDELVSDIVNEMHRRSSMPFSAIETPMQKKLCNIHEDGFKSLVLDVLVVMSQRSPDEEHTPEDVHGLIGNLDKLISSLKEDMVNEERMSRSIYSSKNIPEKIRMFVEYTRDVFSRNGEDTRLPEHMMEEVGKYFEAQAVDGLDLMLDVGMLLRKCDESRWSELPEYRYHRNKIQELESMDLEPEVKKRLVRNEVSQIYSIVATENTRLERATEARLGAKVHNLVDVLCRIKDNANEGKEIAPHDYLGDVAGSTRDILGLFETMDLDPGIHLGHLKARTEALEQIQSGESSEEPLPAMFSTIETVKGILASIPRGREG